MWLERIIDPDIDDPLQAREEFAGWDPYIIQLFRACPLPGPEKASQRAADESEPAPA